MKAKYAVQRLQDVYNPYDGLCVLVVNELCEYEFSNDRWIRNDKKRNRMKEN